METHEILLGALTVILVIMGIIGYLWAYNWDVSCLFAQCVKLK